jgi:hypothetical protein
MDSVGNLLSFLMPTRTHVSSNDINGYGHLNMAYVRSSAGRHK